MPISRILKSRSERQRFLQYAPWLAQTQEEYEEGKTRALQTQSPQLTPILTVNEGVHLFAWAPMTQEGDLPPDSVDSSFHHDLIEDRLQEMWSIALSCTPSLGFSCRWLEAEPPSKHALYCLMGEEGLIQGHSLSASLLIGYLLWISELHPLKHSLVSADITPEQKLDTVDGLQEKMAVRRHLPMIKDLIVADGNQAQVAEIRQDRDIDFHILKDCQQLVERLWGDKETQSHRAEEYIQQQSLDTLVHHIQKIFSVLRGTRLEKINHQVTKALIRHLKRLEKHPKYGEVLNQFGDTKTFKLRMLYIALCRHNHEPIGQLKILLAAKHLQNALTDPVKSRKPDIELWIAEYLQTQRDSYINQDNFTWSTQLKEHNEQQEQLFELAFERLQNTDNSHSRAMLLGSASRVYLLEGQLAEARTLSEQAIEIWEGYSNLGSSSDHELGRPLSIYWRSFRIKYDPCSLKEAMDYTLEYINQNKDLKDGWLFISHECVKSGLWKLRTINEQSTTETQRDVDWVSDLSLNLLYNVCSVFNIRHSLSKISVPKGSFSELMDQQHSNHKDELKGHLYLVGSLCSAIYQSADQIVTKQSDVTSEEIRGLCHDIWDRLLERPGFLKEIFTAQKALATLAPEDLELCRWERIQGISYMAQSWAKAGIQPSRIETFFKDPSQDAELLFELYQRADYLC